MPETSINIEFLNDIPSLATGRDVTQDLLDKQFAKFVVSAERRPRLFLFPDWCKHIEVVRNKISLLGVDAFHGAGKLFVKFREVPIQERNVAMEYASSTFLTTYGFDKPKDEAFGRKLLDEAKAALAKQLTRLYGERM